MTKDFLPTPGMSAALYGISIANKSALSSMFQQNAALTKALDFSRYIPKFDFRPPSPVVDLVRDMSASSIMPTWQKQISAMNPGFALSLDNIVPRMSAMNSLLAHRFTPDINIGEALNFSSALRTASTGVTESILATIKPLSISDILDQAEAFRSEIDDEELAILTDEFFQQQPELATAISELPILVTISRAERLAIIWFVRIAVTLYVAGYLFNLSSENPTLFTILAVLGVGTGTDPGKLAGKATEKLLNVIPSAE